MYTFDNKTVLVTGATGLIGSHIVDALMTLEKVETRICKLYIKS